MSVEFTLLLMAHPPDVVRRMSDELWASTRFARARELRAVDWVCHACEPDAAPEAAALLSAFPATELTGWYSFGSDDEEGTAMASVVLMAAECAVRLDAEALLTYQDEEWVFYRRDGVIGLSEEYARSLGEAAVLFPQPWVAVPSVKEFERTRRG